MTEFTPGPWTVEGREVLGRSPYGKSLPNATGQMVIASPAPHGNEYADESKANARLIAAAPDLLAALEAAVRFFEEATDYEATHPFEYGSPLKARAAIVKARGK